MSHQIRKAVEPAADLTAIQLFAGSGEGPLGVAIAKGQV